MASAVDVGIVRPFEYDDPILGYRVKIEMSEQYTTLHLGDRVLYFIRETGEFDGTSVPMGGRDTNG